MRVRGWVVVAASIAIAGCESAEPPGLQDGAATPTAPPASTPGPSDRPARQTSPATAATTRSYRYACGEDSVVARFQAQHAEVTVGGHILVLAREPSASGVKYADLAGNEFWSKGESEATLTLAGASPLQCVRVDRGPAATADVEFLATGNEPGWIARVARGDRPTLHAEVDYGERKVDVANLRASPDGWRGTASDGTRVALTFERKACRDSMSGRAFETTVTLQVGSRTYDGCGEFGAQ